jgi:hypothetical protein
LVGSYCYECGQKRGDSQVSINQLLSDLFREILDIENRLTKTLRLLLARPGALTSAYLEGRRQSFISPARLYFSSSAVFGVGLALSDSFLTLSLEGGDPDRGAWLRAWLWSVLFMTPTFAALLVLIVRRGYYFAEHLVLALHLHALGFLLAGSGLIALAAFDANLAFVFSVILGIPTVIVVYTTAAFRRCYSMSWASAALSSVIVGSIYVVIQFATWLGIGVLIDSMAA